MTTTKNVKIILTSLGVPVLFSFSLMLVVLLSISPFFLGVNERFTYGVVGSLAALTITYVFLKVDRKTWKDYFLLADSKTLARFIIGFLAGLILASVMFLMQAWYSGLQISFVQADLSQFALMALSLIPLAFMEEIAFRSYAFIKIKNAYGVWVAQFSIAILFALYHYIGGWSLMASFVGTGVWSFAFGWMALRSNGIALPTGFHFGLNLALAVIGKKYWVPALVEIDFPNTPTNAMLQANEYFGGALQAIIFITFVVLTYRYTKRKHGKDQSN